MNATELFRAGKLNDAIRVLGTELRDNPGDDRRRTFLFELLCFAGEFERAAKHLSVLAQKSTDAELGALLYRSALTAERQRQSSFLEKAYPEDAKTVGASRPGTLNGQPFQTIEDADPRIGPRLEVFVAGEYVWLPFEFVGSIEMEPPKKLRDLMWATALVKTSAEFKGKDFGEVLLPVLCPLSWQHADETIKLGRVTEWQQADGQAVPVGQKLLLVDGEEEVPFLEIRELQFTSTASEGDGETSSTSGE